MLSTGFDVVPRACCMMIRPCTGQQRWGRQLDSNSLSTASPGETWWHWAPQWVVEISGT